MGELDKIIETNRRIWDQEAATGGRRSTPWLDLDIEALARFGRGENARFDLPEHDWELLNSDDTTETLMKGAKGKNVLCLASGGGQQSAVYGLLGANVTVLDMSRGQLDADIEASQRYGYDIGLIRLHR